MRVTVLYNIKSDLKSPEIQTIFIFDLRLLSFETQAINHYNHVFVMTLSALMNIETENPEKIV